ncbi:MAG: GNAT family N-acetyltransferase [Bdellovibrionales bacterium]|nr:GNAT family N-acetyltransferase [Bdellovibrionales bacterium]NQZ17774.1 GNAT family N-acetyltransferase [Bdellovibrionales bacterium]
MTSDSLIINFIPKEQLDSILPLVEELNPSIDPELLFLRLQTMKDENFRCIGIFDKEKLIGVCGLWTQTRFYCGKMIEPDGVVIDSKYRSLGLGKKLVEFIDQVAKDESCDVSELNCYLHNPRGLEFWRNNGYSDLGVHMQKKY